MVSSSGLSRLVVAKNIMLTLPLLLLPVVLLAPQTFGVTTPPQSTWAKTYGGSGLDLFHSIQQTSDGGFVAAGSTGSFGGGGGWVVKLDPSGNVVWQNVYGGGGCFGSYSARQTSDGGFIVSVETSSFPANNTCVVKLDPVGNVEWQRAYNGAGDDETFALEETTDGGFVLAGETNYRGGQARDAFLLRLDADGNVAWQKTYGGAGSDVFTSVEPTPDGGFVAAGETESFGTGGLDAWVVKVDASGNVGWQKAYGGPQTDRILSISRALDGSLVGAGGSNSFGQGPLYFDVWVIKLDLDGNLMWQKTYGASQTFSVQQTFDGDFIIAGVIGNDAGFLKLDNNGNVVWQRTYGGPQDDYVFFVQQTLDGGFVGAGLTKSFGVIGGEGSGDAWVLRLDAQGNLRGQCHQKGQSKVATANSLAQLTTTTVTGIDVITTPVVVASTVTPTSAVIGVQCLVTRRP